MTKWWHLYLGTWLAAAILSAIFTYVCKRLAPRLGLLDKPLHEAHKLHTATTPVIGGVAMCLAWVLVIGAGLLGSMALKNLVSDRISLYLPGIQTVGPQLLAIVGGGAAFTALGAIDDRFRLGALPKFVGQFCVAGAIACWGVRITIFVSQPVLTWALTTLWIMTIVNAMNFFDNMDGLAAGTAAIAAFLFLFVAGIRGQYFVGVLAAATLGSACGFLLFNLPPASIFMGDGGSHFLGCSLAVIGALTTFYTPRESPTPIPVLIPLFVLGLPLFDAAAVVFMRLLRGKPIYVGDNTHISHRFEKLGLSRPQAVLLVCLLSFTIGSGAVALLWLPLAGSIIVLLQTIAVLSIVSIIQFCIPETDRPSC
jgi:UDP-GlcNAc:undecaprenyl-phosphate GlcNAc-1-phosphate transferase